MTALALQAALLSCVAFAADDAKTKGPLVTNLVHRMAVLDSGGDSQ